ncbi:bifunctional UDP-N-acetylglucosamine pyrophosphorylase/glucosamine-1-phosphate N-acetyltransferase [Litorimonas taeanensis]|uniref:Bifunctional protein GlmU n=1 Tax=Litorimonas taeanensis TaxID=568099 RepID=A0A420WKJ1_9PROT|nr:bifunctional UDP-N-acetylglucosamine diphosphorylase/glucosamine-1-phosphate N-acetyltransferase GlmU [Litorimonas taeanensis]RKQ71543.1 bifunctional UDP-N-acetylglucosamine pyrophosphorylase/glucosamine-1-phosphate N-acetyltransferase [Litorimonas taeanensis]
MTSSKKRAAVILAAGKSTRMRSVKSKVLHPVGHRPLIEWVGALAASANVERTVCVVGEANQDVRSAAEAMAFDIAIQEPQLGTAHAVNCAREALGDFDGQVVVLYADTPLIRAETLQKVFERLDDTADLVVMGFNAEDPAAYGRLVMRADDSLEAIVEARECSAEQLEIGLCNSGVMAGDCQSMLKAIALVDDNNAKGEFYLTDIVEIMNNDGKRSEVVIAEEAEVLGVNNRRDLANAEAAFQDVMRERALENGVSLKHPESVYFAYDTIIESDVTVDANVVFGPGAIVRSHAVIHSFCHIEGAEIGNGAQIGPFARLRPGTILGEETKVGNFVETKKTRLGKGSKINHLSYIGDADLGAGVNVGAGTITCNYDGFDKHKTTIKDGAFIGTNSSLVAPVTIGEGAYLGSGGVITNDVPDNALAVARAKQSIKEGWAERYRAAKAKRKATSQNASKG